MEIPDKSFIDITYIIKEEDINNEEKKEEGDIPKSKYNTETEIEVGYIKHSSENDRHKNNMDGKFLTDKKFFTPAIQPKIPSILPKIFQLNPSNENIDDDLAQKIFSKIFNKSPIENQNNLIEIINYKDIINDKGGDDESSINENINIESIAQIQQNETFCLGIFISGLKPPIENKNYIDNSYNFIAPCGHKNCSSLLSMKPELISTYINKNSQISQELNYLVANLCFPLGIKLCFEMSNDINNNMKDKNIIQQSQNIYYNVIKNAKDDIFYIATLQYFIKMEIKEFKEKYKFDLNSYYSQNANKIERKDSNSKRTTTSISQLFEGNFIYVPETISLLSKYPFFIPMNICLNNIINLQTTQEKIELINHIINEIPTPQKLRQIQFYIPLVNEPIILNHSFNIYKGLSMMDDSNENITNDNLSLTQLNSKILLEKISIENIIIIFQLLLLEQQILIVENNYQVLSEIILIFISLIYPLTWTNPFLPILSLNTFQFLQTPVPYIMGLDEYLLKYAYNSKNIYFGNEIIIYNLMTKNFILSRTKKKASKKDIKHEFKLKFLPEKIENYMSIELKKLKIIMDSKKMNDISLDMEIRLVFVKIMILLIGDYNNYTFYTNDDNMPLFNKEAFIESHKEKQIKLFFGQMTKTQLFNQFLLNERQLYFYNNNKVNNYNINNENNTNDNFDINNCVDTSYFKKMILKYPQLINNEEIRKSSFDLNLNNENSSQSSGFHSVKRCKSNINLKLKFDNKKDKLTPISIISEKDQKLTIDFNKCIINSPEIKNLTKSHNFDLPLHFNNQISNVENDLNIKKTMTSKYSNIIIKKTNKIKKYLLYPYFLPPITKEEIDTLTPKTINEKVVLYNKNIIIIPNNNNNNNKVFIPQKALDFDFNQINQNKYYVIEEQNNCMSGVKEKTQKKQNLTEKINTPTIESKTSLYSESLQAKSSKSHKKIKKNHTTKKKSEKRSGKSKNKTKNINHKLEPKINLLHKLDNYDNMEFINKCFISCCTNKHRITKEQFTSLETIFSDTHNKNYFANLMIPDMRIKNKNEHKQLISTSFEDLTIIMKMCLEKLTHEENQIGRLLTIACFTYYKIDKDKNIIYLYQCFNKEAVYPCKLWLIDEFWTDFFQIEMSEAKNKEDELINNYDNNNNINEFFDNSIIEFKSKDAILLENSLYVSKIMIKLNLNQIFIMNVFEKMILPVYESDYQNIRKIMKIIISLFPI